MKKNSLEEIFQRNCYKLKYFGYGNPSGMRSLWNDALSPAIHMTLTLYFENLSSNTLLIEDLLQEAKKNQFTMEEDTMRNVISLASSMWIYNQNSSSNFNYRINKEDLSIQRM